jgi:phospholipid/cholesterol/gamma-HCH transport system substrate-binding protein
MRKLLLAAGAAALLGVTGCSLQPNDYTLPGQTGVGSDGYTVTVHFKQVENLVPNSTVQLDNVTVGTVAGIEARNWQADVKLRLLKKVKVPSNAVFSIGQKTLLGAQYVEITEPKATATRAAALGVLSDGDVIGTEQTGSYPSTEEVLGSAALLLNNGGLSQISVLTGQLSTALRHREPNTRDLITKTNQLLGVLDRNRGNVISALSSLDRLSTTLRNRQGVIAKAIDRITPGLKALNAERDNLVHAVTSTGKVSTRAAQVVAVNQRALLANLDSLQPILGHLSTVATQLPDALKIGITIPFPAMTTTKAIKGDYANLFANIDLRLPGLAKNFLGIGLASAVTGLNPLAAPLVMPHSTAPSTSKSKAKKSGTKATSTPSTPAAPTSSSPSPSTKHGVCLLGLIGDC